MIKKPKVIIFSDGSCSRTVGGWAASLYCNGESLHISGHEPNTTNNRMELMAVIQALSILTTSCVVELYSDSSYVCDGIAFRLKQWSKNGWRVKDGSPVKNIDLWKTLLELIITHKVKAKWVKAHNGNPNNETVDSLAQHERTVLEKQLF